MSSRSRDELAFGLALQRTVRQPETYQTGLQGRRRTPRPPLPRLRPARSSGSARSTGSAQSGRTARSARRQRRQGQTGLVFLRLFPFPSCPMLTQSRSSFVFKVPTVWTDPSVPGEGTDPKARRSTATPDGPVSTVRADRTATKVRWDLKAPSGLRVCRASRADPVSSVPKDLPVRRVRGRMQHATGTRSRRFDRWLSLQAKMALPDWSVPAARTARTEPAEFPDLPVSSRSGDLSVSFVCLFVFYHCVLSGLVGQVSPERPDRTAKTARTDRLAFPERSVPPERAVRTAAMESTDRTAKTANPDPSAHSVRRAGVDVSCSNVAMSFLLSVPRTCRTRRPDRYAGCSGH